MPSANARLTPSAPDTVKNNAITKNATPAATATEILGAAPEGASRILRADGQVNGVISHGCSGPSDSIFARRRAGTGSSNPMAENSAGGAPTITIPSEIQLRQAGVHIPTNERKLPLTTSIANYSRRLSKESLEGLEKVVAKRDGKPEPV